MLLIIIICYGESIALFDEKNNLTYNKLILQEKL